MTLPGKILFAFGGLCALIGLFLWGLSYSRIDGAALAVRGGYLMLISYGYLLIGKKRSNKRAWFDWIFLFVMLILLTFITLKK